MAARYKRALTRDSFIDALKSNDSLMFLIHDLPDLNGDTYAINVQLREGNQLMYYHGTTRLLVVTLLEKDRQVCFRISANKTYSSGAACSESFKQLADLGVNDPSKAGSTFQKHLKSALSVADRSCYCNRKEGYWQNRLCVRYGARCQAEDDWLIIDRECVIGFANNTEKRDVFHPHQVYFETIRHAFQTQDKKRWGGPTEVDSSTGEVRSRLGDELDMLAIGKDGQLLAIELKDGANTKGIYWGPLQVGTYKAAFNAVLTHLERDIHSLIKQKVDLGLLPSHALRRLEKVSFSSVVPVLAIAAPNPRSGCWSMLAEVMKSAGTVSVVTIDSPVREVAPISEVATKHIVLNDTL